MAISEQTERLVYNIPEVAALLGIGQTSVREAIHRKEIPSFKIGARVLIPKMQLDRMLAGEPADGLAASPEATVMSYRLTAIEAQVLGGYEGMGFILKEDVHILELYYRDVLVARFNGCTDAQHIQQACSDFISNPVPRGTYHLN